MRDNMQRFHDGRDWFFERRLGLFLHWGLYAIHGLHEQEQQRYGVPAEEYEKLTAEFHPRRFDPERWLDLAEEAGMEYLVLTAKHHDGFCLWPSRETDFHVGNTPYRQDIVRQVAGACARRGIPLEFYYSVVDWHQENYPNLGRHHEIRTDPARHDWNRYLDYLKRQITELCTQYGPVAGIWWDMNVPQAEAPEVHELIRRLQPGAVVNNRGFGPGDYSTPERDFDPENANRGEVAFARPTEACQSIGFNSWGYRRDEDYYSILYFLRSIDTNLARGGNYLLNVGPDADGIIPEPGRKILHGVGTWYRRVRESFAEPIPGLTADPALLVTRRGDAVYIHCPRGLSGSALSLHPLKQPPTRVTLLNTGEAVEWTLEPLIYYRDRGAELRLRNLDADALSGTVPVFKLEFDRPPEFG